MPRWGALLGLEAQLGPFHEVPAGGVLTGMEVEAGVGSFRAKPGGYSRSGSQASEETPLSQPSLAPWQMAAAFG